MIKHFYHGCALSSSEFVADGICNLCYNDKPVGFSCKACNFDLCEFCSKLPPKVSHDFHPKHPLVFCLGEDDRKPRYVICSGCGNMCSGSFYECKECEVYLDLECAVEANIFRSWDVKEKLHDSHCHLLRRCKPGPDATGSCLLCESPISPSAICYGCVHCYLFVHERCFDLPREIQHPVHPAHPLKRLGYVRICHGKTICDACELHFNNAVPFGCLECDVDFHLRCADTLLRGLMHKSHEHKLFYVPNKAKDVFGENNPCQICMGTEVLSSLDSYYHCVECGLKFHFECLEIPESIFKKRYHIHPLICKVFNADNDSLEYCGVCETMVYAGYHVYSCEECDYLGHIECILREEVPSPLYLKDLYSGNKSIKKPNKEECEGNEVEHKILVRTMTHVHVMRPVDMSYLDSNYCVMCDGKILSNPLKCEQCNFQTHHFCAKLGKPSYYQGLHREHPNHPLTLLQRVPVGASKICDTCKSTINGFNLLCRICDISIHINCVLKDKYFRGASQQGQKVIGVTEDECMYDGHPLFKVLVSSSYPNACTICDETLCRKVISCMECGDIYHPKCIENGVWTTFGHPLHPFHTLKIHPISGYMCLACKLNITKYGLHCSTCEVGFHTKCIKAVDVSRNASLEKSSDHYLYNFWMDTSNVTQVCNVCGRPCGPSFYGCICCNFKAHVDCLGFPTYVKNQLHQHTLKGKNFSLFGREVDCSICGLKNTTYVFYSCKHCKESFHSECIMSMDDREAATEEEQIVDIYLMFLERDLRHVLAWEKKNSKQA